jgi:hypothetical protein
MEVVINKEIMKLKFEEKDFTQLGRTRNKYIRWDLFWGTGAFIFRSLNISRYVQKISFVNLG